MTGRIKSDRQRYREHESIRRLEIEIDQIHVLRAAWPDYPGCN